MIWTMPGGREGILIRTIQTQAAGQRGISEPCVVVEAAARVFSEMPYDRVSLAHIAAEANIDLATLQTHFTTTGDIAASVLDVQQERVTEVLSRVMEAGASWVGDRLALIHGVAELMASDSLVQAGMALVDSLPEDLQDTGHGFYEEWQNVTETLIAEGIADGSVTSTQPTGDLAELLNEIFVGAQILSGMQDRWTSLPKRIRLAEPVILSLLVPRR
mgnify:FL=1